MMSLAMVAYSLIDNGTVTLHYHCPSYMILLYPFRHANVFHCLANVWCLLVLLYSWELTLRELAMAYIVSLIYGALIYSLPSSLSVVGFSSVTYALAGLHSWSGDTRHDVRYIATILTTVIITSLIPRLSATTHLACYLIALAISIVSYKIKYHHDEK